MRRLLGLTRRSLLIAIHDALATALAVLLSFFLRFGEIDFSVRLPMLLVILPYFVASQRRRLLLLQSDHDEVAIHVASRDPQHRQGVDHSQRRAAGARLRLRGAERLRRVLFRQDHHRHLLAAPDRAAERDQACLSLLSNGAHANNARCLQTQRRSCCWATPPKRSCSSAASRAARCDRSGRWGCFRRRIADRGPDDPRHSLSSAGSTI